MMLVSIIVSSISYFENKKSQLFMDLKSFIKKKKTGATKILIFSFIYHIFIIQQILSIHCPLISTNVYILPTRLLMQLKETFSPSARLFFLFQQRLHSTNQAVQAAKGDFFSLCNTFFCQWEHHLHICHGIIYILCGIIRGGGEGRHVTTCYKNIKY